MIVVIVALNLCAAAALDGLAFRCEPPDAPPRSVVRYLHNPPVIAGDVGHTSASGGVVNSKFCVSLIAGFCDIPQINDSVVVTDAVDVVNLVGGPRSMKERPRNTMRFVRSAQKPARPVTCPVVSIERAAFAGHGVPCVAPVGRWPFGAPGEHIRRSSSPPKKTGFTVVANEAGQFRDGQ